MSPGILHDSLESHSSMATALVQGLGVNEGHKGGAAQPLQQDKHPQTLGQRSQRADDGGSTDDGRGQERENQHQET